MHAHSLLLGLCLALLAHAAPAAYLAILGVCLLGVALGAIAVLAIAAWCVAGDPANRPEDAA